MSCSSSERCWGEPVRPLTLRRSVLFIAAALSLLLPPLAMAGDQHPPPSPLFRDSPAPGHNSDTPQTPTGTTGGTEPSRVVNYVPVQSYSGCDFSIASGPAGASEARAANLDKHGPQLPPLYSMSTFSVMGFTRGGWPVVIDYLLEKDSLLMVIVAPEGSTPLIYRLEGKKGHWQSRLQIPAGVGDQPRVAQYVIQTLDNNVGQVGPSHVHIHGIAAGPKAVGSIGIDQVNFGPGTLTVAKHDKIPYSFHSMFDFKNTEVTFVRLAQYKGEIVAAAVSNKSTGSINKGALKNGEWDGSTKMGELPSSYPPELQQWLRDSRGQHVLQVRAWYGVKDGGDWVTALSDTMVTVE
jgi:hypothetical protein